MESGDRNTHTDAGTGDPDSRSVNTDSNAGSIKPYADAGSFNADARPIKSDTDADTHSLLRDRAAVRSAGRSGYLYVPVSDARSAQWQVSAVERQAPF